MSDPTRYAAFLRGINLGRRRVTGDDLRAVFAGAGFTGVGTFLASGNVVFETPATAPSADDGLTAGIEAALERSLGYAVPTFLRTEPELRSIVALAPFSAEELEQSAGKLQVMLLRAEPTAEARAAVLAHGSEGDRLALYGKELYWLPQGNMSDSPLDLAAIDRVLGPATIRTANTLARLHARFFSDPGGRA
jgi:uncharacterized protein (DUF1697 family)